MKLMPVLRVFIPLTVAVAFVKCGSKSTTGPTPPGSATSTAPAATQPPTTTAPAAPRSLCQRLAPVNPERARCSRTSPAFLGAVDGAIAKVMAQNPSLFQGTRILSVGSYYVKVIESLNADGFCAAFDGEELQIREQDDMNEQYDISSATGFVRSGDAAYRSTCSPAAFPTAAVPPGPSPAGCSLPPSREVACGYESPHFLGAVEDVIDDVVKSRDDLFNTNDIKKGTDDGYKVLDVKAYTDAVTQGLVRKGFCARFDGEEEQVKSNNDSSELFDIITSDNYIRRGNGIYRSTCYPASF